MARVGGNQFAVLAMDVAPLQADLLVQRFAQAVNQADAARPAQYRLAVHTGISHVESTAQLSLSRLWTEALDAMNLGKRNREDVTIVDQDRA
jgi:GGDEF domain-containing protein